MTPENMKRVSQMDSRIAASRLWSLNKQIEGAERLIALMRETIKEGMEEKVAIANLGFNDPVENFCIKLTGGRGNPELHKAIVDANAKIAKCPGQVAMTVRRYLRGNHPNCFSTATDSDVKFYVLTGKPLLLPEVGQDSASVDGVLIPCSSWAMVEGRAAEGDTQQRYMPLPMAFLQAPQTDSMAWELLIGTDEVSNRINCDDFFVSDDGIPLVRPDDYLRATAAIGWVEGRPMPEVVKKYFDGWVAGLHVRYTGAVAVGQENAFFSNARMEAKLFGFDPEQFLVDLTGNAVPKD